MLHKIILVFLLGCSVQAQLNGEFWWLNKKLAKFRNVNPTPPKIEESDFEIVENAKIIFRDEDTYFTKMPKPIQDRAAKLQVYNDSSENKIVWPDEAQNYGMSASKLISKSNKIQEDNKDALVFTYPKGDNVTVDYSSTESITSVQNTSTKTVVTTSGKIAYTGDHILGIAQMNKESQNICTYVKKTECYQQKGLIYKYARRHQYNTKGDQLLCCILPIQPTPKSDYSHSIIFPSETKIRSRRKRSNNGENISLKQRDFLLRQKYTPQNQKLKPASTPTTKIVTPDDDDYVDPYWNIKNTDIHKPNKPQVKTSQHDYYGDDSFEEYTAEIPKPGLVGLYSDHAMSPSSWDYDTEGFDYGNSDDYVDNEEDDTFGYSVIDPRQGTQKQKRKRKPSKLTSTDENAYDDESQVINFQSDPDFRVLQGFKLLNLFRNMRRIRTKNKRTTTDQYDSKETIVTHSEREETDDFVDENQIFDGCGKAVVMKSNDRDKLIAETVNGSHPWLLLVVLTKTRHNVLCYATLVHPRAAVTVADCVQGTSPGDITIVAGLWDLNDRTRSKDRVAAVIVHPRYKPGEVDNNLAVLHWKRPLQLGVNIQPACIGAPHIGDDCKFFGWDGLDQVIQQRSRWQRATIRFCNAHKRESQSSGAFCATVPRGTVTGLGGPLVCDASGRSSVVGVVVSRDGGYTLLPVREWTTKTHELLSRD